MRLPPALFNHSSATFTIFNFGLPLEWNSPVSFPITLPAVAFLKSAKDRVCDG